MTTPKRVQMSRQHPWRADFPDAVVVARPSRWGNPVRIDSVLYVEGPEHPEWGHAYVWNAEWAVYHYRNWIIKGSCKAFLGLPPTRDEIQDALAGRDLACWCPLDQPCHADVLLKLANPAVPGA